MNTREFPGSLRSRANLLRQFGHDERGARILESVATELEQIMKAEEDELLTPGQAAKECGVPAGTLRRMLRTGQLKDRSEKEDVYLIRRGDLPRAAITAAEPEAPPAIALHVEAGASSRRQIARAVVSGG